jgi:hypothetical protein
VAAEYKANEKVGEVSLVDKVDDEPEVSALAITKVLESGLLYQPCSFR